MHDDDQNDFLSYPAEGKTAAEGQAGPADRVPALRRRREKARRAPAAPSATLSYGSAAAVIDRRSVESCIGEVVRAPDSPATALRFLWSEVPEPERGWFAASLVVDVEFRRGFDPEQVAPQLDAWYERIEARLGPDAALVALLPWIGS